MVIAPDASNKDASRLPKIVIPMGKRWYIYGHTEIDANGKKSPLIPIRKTIPNWRSRSHISTVMTAADGSELVYGFPLDLDFEAALEIWKKRGKLDYKGIKAFIDKTYPILGRYLCTYTRSTGEKGLGLVLFFDPFLRHHEKTGSVNRLAESVQRLLITVLNFHGLGCDKNASGIVRFTPNWRNNRILLHKDEVTIRKVQRDNEAHDVLRHVYNELRRSEAVKSPTRLAAVESGERFAVKDCADAGLGRIYAHILDSEPESLILSSSYEELSKLSGLSTPTLRKYLCAAPWLSVTVAYGTGLTIKLTPTAELSARSLGDGPTRKPTSSRGLSANEWDLPAPEDVLDGDRNNYLWRKAVLLRNEGLSLSDAISSIGELSTRIPGSRSSRSCRSIESIVSSIYRHTRRAPQSKRKIFPLEALTKSQSYVPDPAPCEGWQEGEAKNEEEGREEKPLDMVSMEEDIHPTPRQGGQGELPPDSTLLKGATTTDPAFLAWLTSMAPKAFEKTCVTSMLADAAPQPISFAEVIPMFKEENGSGSPRKTVSLREARVEKCREINPLDRFEKALHRCQGDENIIISVLTREHERLCIAKRDRHRYRAPEGPFKRLCEAFAFVSERMREDVLLVLRN